MGFNFIGEVHTVREHQLKFISEILQERGIKRCDVSIEPVGKTGDNFMSNIKRIVVNENGETFKMIAKLAPELRNVTDVAVSFKNEHTMYMELFPLFKVLQENAGVPEKDRLRIAECYGTFIESPNEVILLEDLKVSNFGILNKLEPLSTECVKLVLKNYAVLHSLSYVLKEQEPEKFLEIASKFGNAYNEPSHLRETMNRYHQTLENDVLDHLNDERYKTVFNGTMKNVKELISELARREKGSKSSVIQHGDAWTNNIMFSFVDKKPSTCLLVDYQMTKESSPVYDIMYMLFNSTETNQRIEHYTEFIDYYYNELDKSLSNYGLKVKDIYPRDQLNADMKIYMKLILAISIIVSNLIVKDVANASELRNAMETSNNVTEDLGRLMTERPPASEALFRKRIEGLAKSVVELELL